MSYLSNTKGEENLNLFGASVSCLILKSMETCQTTKSKMFFNNDMFTCGVFDFPALFRKARGIKNPWRLHPKSANMDQRVLQSSYGAILAAALSSLHKELLALIVLLNLTGK